MLYHRKSVRSHKNKKLFIAPGKTITSKLLKLIFLFSILFFKNHAYSLTNYTENQDWYYSISKKAAPVVARTLFSIDRLHSTLPLLSWALRSSLLKTLQVVSRINNSYTVTYQDIKTINDYAKTTKHGYYEISSGGKRLYFIASEDLANQLIALEGQETNNFTDRRLRSLQNWFLLENNPVAARDMQHHTYGRKQSELFHYAFVRLQHLSDISALFVNTKTSGYLYGQHAEDLVSNLLTQIYFQILFSSVTPAYPVNRDIQKNVQENHHQIKALYELLEAHTGKYNLTANILIRGYKPFPKTHPYSNILLLEKFYNILCHLYEVPPSFEVIQDDSHDLTVRETIALRTVELLRTNNAAVLPVFAPSLTQDIQNISPEEALNIVFNLLSWIDNSLNISNTAMNFIIHVAEHYKENQHLVDMDKLFVDEVHNLRALATLFARNVNRPFSVTTTSEAGEHSLLFKAGDKILITNSIKGHAFGYQPRKCPSRPYSTYILPRFLHYLLQNYHARFDARSRLIPESTSWFWNKLDTRPLTLEPRL
ncbi:hypothetical protein [Endozoicomonas sp.]|uniref:hypothetical protein n=1 Tax=Endozoicomonas sp. TaxID=1892382 RepID=UPI00288610B2|nr:hypothetical protein [Endozoicomonas sp.]